MQNCEKNLNIVKYILFKQQLTFLKYPFVKLVSRNIFFLFVFLQSCKDFKVSACIPKSYVQPQYFLWFSTSLSWFDLTYQFFRKDAVNVNSQSRNTEVKQFPCGS